MYMVPAILQHWLHSCFPAQEKGGLVVIQRNLYSKNGLAKTTSKLSYFEGGWPMDVSRFDPFEIDFQINFQLIIEREGSCVDVSRFTSIQIYFPIDFQIFFSPDFII